MKFKLNLKFKKILKRFKKWLDNKFNNGVYIEIDPLGRVKRIRRR